MLLGVFSLKNKSHERLLSEKSRFGGKVLRRTHSVKEHMKRQDTTAKEEDDRPPPTLRYQRDKALPAARLANFPSSIVLVQPKSANGSGGKTNKKPPEEDAGADQNDGKEAPEQDLGCTAVAAFRYGAVHLVQRAGIDSAIKNQRLKGRGEGASGPSWPGATGAREDRV